jgi:hypothetical protein
MFVCATAANAQRLLAPAPPMGWNSWDAYGTTVTEQEVRANADVMASDLKQYGWRYVVVDIQWYEPNAKAHGYRAGATLSMDQYGRLIPAPNRFPSAAHGSGFGPLAKYLHSKGLKFGIHILRGIPRQAVTQNSPVLGSSAHAADIADRTSVCSWNGDMYGVDMSKPGAQAYYNSIVKQYAAWGVDFIKADDMSRPYHAEEIAALHQAIVASGRPMVLSLSPGAAPLDQLQHLRANAEMWRIEDDLWDNWKSVRRMYDRAETWVPDVQQGHWPDADMLPLGHIGIRAERGEDRLSLLTQDEQRFVMTLWAIFRSPLIFGGDLPSLDPFTRSLLTNREVIEVNQRGNDPKLAHSEGEVRVWRSNGSAPHSQTVALFNLSDSEQVVNLSWEQVGLASATSVHDLWNGGAMLPKDALHRKLAPHSSALYRVQ